MEGEKALNVWRCCLEAGDSMAHFAIGYTLYELERYREAYGHLRHYAELAPQLPGTGAGSGAPRRRSARSRRRAKPMSARSR